MVRFHAFTVVMTALAVVGPSAAGPQSTPLAPGEPVVQQLTAGEAFVYDVALRAGECAHVTVEQRGVDVVLEVRSADDVVVANVDGESRPSGSETVDLVADADSTFHVKVRARFPHHPAGGYAIAVDPARTAAERDMQLADARKSVAQADAARAAGKYDQSAASLNHALEIAESAVGPHDSYVGLLLQQLGAVERTRGNNTTAESLLLRAIAIDEETLGRKDLQTVAAIGQLGSMYRYIQEYNKAEPLLKEELASTEAALGEWHPRMVGALMDLSVLYDEREDDESDEAVLQRALTIAERTLDQDDFQLLAIENNLGNMYQQMDKDDRGEPLLRKALEGIERTLGPDSIRVTNPLLSLAIISRKRGQFDQSVADIERAHAVRAKVLGAQHAETASTLITLGNTYTAAGNYSKALDSHLQALGVLETTVGPYHRLTLLALINAERAYAALGQTTQALAFETRVDGIIEKSLALNDAMGSERERRTYFDSIIERTGRTVSLHVNQAPTSPDAADLAALVLLQRKGRLQDAMSNSLATLRARLDPADQQLLDQFKTTTASLAQAALSGPGKTPFADYQKRLRSLEQQHEQLESDISDRSAQFRSQETPVTLEAVRAAIPAHAVLIEFAVYQPFNPKGTRDEEIHSDLRYVAYVLSHDGEVRWKDLGKIADVDRAVAAFRRALRDPARTDVTELGRDLDRQVMQPLRSVVGDATTRLLISPDGDLNLVPFEALVDEDGRYLVERYAINYLTTGRDLLRLGVPRSPKNPPTIVANPLFGEPVTSPARTVEHGAMARRSVTAGDDRSDMYFAPLSGTGYEAQTIKSLFPNAQLLDGKNATKAALARVDAPLILHIATHGFFLRDDPPDNASPGPNGSRGAKAEVHIDNPLLRSGLALAGANLKGGDEASGVLTALEAANLNLWGTKLVTLSACDTGVGEIRTGDGVYGLRRAFFLAGAETLVMSLWPVSDSVTREMMSTYYAGLKDGLGRGDALRRAQLAMRLRKNRQHPFYWAGFIQAGEWADLKGHRPSTD
jgi:CHAT domain-containing protein